jgi:hypothetical protein
MEPITPSPRNANHEVMGSIFNVLLLSQVVEREFLFQYFNDGGKALQKHPDGFVAYVGKLL